MVDEDSWRRVLHIINRYDNPVVVVSATARTTRQLVAAAEAALSNFSKAEGIASDIFDRHKKIVENFFRHSKHEQKDYFKLRCAQWLDEFYMILNGELREIFDEKEISAQQKDLIMSLGEELSSFLFSVCGKMENFPMEWIDARVVIKTDSNYGRARPDMKKIKSEISSVYKKAEKDYIPVMGGFYGQDEKGNTTTLGFEGSDYSASLIGAALNAEAIEIWTDVSGIYTCDPCAVPSAKPIDKLSFRDAAELAKHGAKVLHPSTMEPASSKGIPVFVKNIFDEADAGTKIDNTANKNRLCKAIAFFKDATIFSVNTASRSIREHRLVEVFAVLDEYDSTILAIDTKKKAVSLILKNTSKTAKLENELKEISTVSKLEKMGVISLIGCDRSVEERKKNITTALQTEPELFIFDSEKKVLNIVLNEIELLPSVRELHKLIFE